MKAYIIIFRNIYNTATNLQKKNQTAYTYFAI